MLKLNNIQSQKFIVMGLGRTGMSTCIALQASGKQVIAWDDQPDNRQAAHDAGISLSDPLDIPWSGVSALILSPGIPHSFPAPHPVAERAQIENVPIICDIELLVTSHTQPTFIGVTGTNGKSTTTALIGHLLRESGQNIQVGGNIGVPVCDLESLHLGGTYVLELSSYQLERTPSLNLDIAVLLNITEDHLSRHGGMHGYIAAKNKIFQAHDKKQIAIISMEDAYCQQLAFSLRESLIHQVVPISRQGAVSGGIYIQNEWLYDDAFACQQQILHLPSITSLRGYHNWQNILHAYAVARAMGIPAQNILELVNSFKNLPHRMEEVGVINHITWVNDSKATNAESTYHALAAYDDIYWILGGLPKETELQGLEQFYPKIRHAFTIGQATDLFAELLEGHVPVTRCHTLMKATEQAFQKSSGQKKGVVLLSPVCASFDQFTDYVQRGDTFRHLVKALSLKYTS